MRYYYDLRDIKSKYIRQTHITGDIITVIDDGYKATCIVKMSCEDECDECFFRDKDCPTSPDGILACIRPVKDIIYKPIDSLLEDL